MKGNETLASELEKFLICLNASEGSILACARYEVEKKSLLKARRPCRLPLEKDIEKIHSSTLQVMDELTDNFEFWTAHSFIRLRNVVLTRLTLLNGRRGGEIGRLLIREWREAENNVWIDKQRLNDLTDAEMMLVDNLKISYMSGKGNRHIVSVMFPKDTVCALNKLADPKLRSNAGVAERNEFLFPSTQNSELNVSGWHSLKFVCGELQLENSTLINATNNRHRVSTLYAALDLPRKDRELFYSHMGHSESMNRDVYQAPLALMGITKTGKQLLQIEKSKFF